MKLGWENMAPENLLIRNRRNFWFLVEYRAKHTAGHLKTHSQGPPPMYGMFAVFLCCAKYLNYYLWHRCWYSCKETEAHRRQVTCPKSCLSGRADIWSQAYYPESSQTTGIEIQLKPAYWGEKKGKKENYWIESRGGFQAQMEPGGQSLYTYISPGSLSSVLDTSYIGSLYVEGWILPAVELPETY